MFRLGEFTFRVATDPAMVEALYRLRYQVYVKEYGYEKAEDHPHGLEKDRYDAYAVPMAALDRKGKVVGSVRLIPPSPLGQPAVELAFPWKREAILKNGTPFEVSRMAVSREFGGASLDLETDLDHYLKHVGGDSPARGESGAPPNRAVIVLGLIQLMGQVAHSMGATHLLMTAEKPLQLFLKRHGLLFQSIGSETNYHGKRAPYAMKVADALPVLMNFRNKLLADLHEGEGGSSPSRHRTLAEGESFLLGGLEFAVASDQETIDKIHILRRQLVPAEFAADVLRGASDSRETDRYDSSAVPIAALDGEEAVGAARLILNSPLGLPALQAARPALRHPLEGSRKVAEISRLVLAPAYGRAVGGAWAGLFAPPFSKTGEGRSVVPSRRDRRRAAILLIGLMRMIYRVSKRLRVTGWLVMANEESAEAFAKRGIMAHSLGPASDAAGRAPRLLRLHEIEGKLLDFGNVRALASDMVGRSGRPATGGHRSNFLDFLAGD
jgi:N-acyl amino acid synthase of PEP-CTERM/exosortase system